MGQIRTLIVDDQDDIRLLLRTVIDLANDGLAVVAEASSGTEALTQADACDPSVVVIDEMMPEMSGLETARRLLARRPGQILVLCSAYLDEKIRQKAREVGINACLAKDHVHDLPDLLRVLAVAGTG